MTELLILQDTILHGENTPNVQMLQGRDGVLGVVGLHRNDEDIRFLEKMETSLEDGDVLAILPALAGG